MKTRRRDILSSVGIVVSTSLSGCLDGRLESTTGGHGTTTIEGVDSDSPPEVPVVPEVSVVNAEATAEAPAGIAVNWENEANHPVRLGEERGLVFHPGRSDDEDARLLSDEWGDLAETVSYDGCWYVSGVISGDGAFRVANLEPGDRYGAGTHLYADSNECLTSGTYRFQTNIGAWNPDGSEEEEATDIEWGFDLHIDIEG